MSLCQLKCPKFVHDRKSELQIHLRIPTNFEFLEQGMPFKPISKQKTQICHTHSFPRETLFSSTCKVATSYSFINYGNRIFEARLKTRIKNAP